MVDCNGEPYVLYVKVFQTFEFDGTDDLVGNKYIRKKRTE